MDPITEQDLVDIIRERQINRWVLRKCSFCGDELTYTFVVDGAEFDPNCNCSPRRSPPLLSPLSEIVDLLNRQTPEVRARLWTSLTGT